MRSSKMSRYSLVCDRLAPICIKAFNKVRILVTSLVRRFKEELTLDPPLGFTPEPNPKLPRSSNAFFTKRQPLSSASPVSTFLTSRRLLNSPLSSSIESTLSNTFHTTCQHNSSSLSNRDSQVSSSTFPPPRREDKVLCLNFFRRLKRDSRARE